MRSYPGIAIALAVLMLMAGGSAPSLGQSAQLTPQAEAFKRDGIVECTGNLVYRGLEYKRAEKQCECVFDVYARKLTPDEITKVEQMSALLRAKQPDKSDPVVIAGANALMRVNPEMMRSCKVE